MLVDWHSHYLSEAELNFLATRTAAPRLLRAEDGSAYIDNLATASGANLSFNGVAASNVEARLRQMDENGVRWQLLCQTIPLGFDATLPLDEQKRLYKRAKPMWIRSANSHTGPQPKAASEAGQTRAPDYVPDLI